MPIAESTAGLIAAGAGLLGQGANAYAQGKTNRATRRYNQDMFHMQNMWDNIEWQAQNKYNEDWWMRQQQYFEGLWNKQNKYNEELWHRQNAYNEEVWNKQNEYNEERWKMENEYNSPAAQMARFKAAGLNPHLIYGQSNMGGTIASGQFATDTQATDEIGRLSKDSSNMSNSGPMPWNPRAPQFDVQEGVMSYFRSRQMQAQTNNLEAQNALIAQQTAKVAQETARNKFDLELSQELRNTSLEAAKEALEQTKRKNNYISEEIRIMQNRDQREAALNSSSIREAAARIAQINQQKLTEEQKTEAAKLDNELKRNGVQPHDWVWWRALQEYWDWTKNQFKKNWKKHENNRTGQEPPNSNIQLGWPE